MNLIKCFVLITLGVSMVLTQTQNFSCPVIKCSTANLGEGICASTAQQNTTAPDNTTYFTLVTQVSTGICKSGQTCPATSVLGSQACVDTKPGQGVDGDSCNSISDCYSNTCTNNKCVGLPNGAGCDNTGMCKVSDYCTGNNRTLNTSTCQPQLHSGGVCTQTTDCENNNDCLNGKCTPYFSVADGTTLPVAFNPLICKSGYSHNNVCTQFLYLGPKGDYTTNGTDKKCNYNWTSQNITELHDGVGVCGIDGTFTRYCYFPGTDSDVFQEKISKVNAWLNGDGNKVHSLKRFNYPYSTALAVDKVDGSYWPRLNNADKCAVNYLTTLTSDGMFAKFSAFVFFGLLLLI